MKKVILTSVTILFIGVAAFAGNGDNSNKKNEKKHRRKNILKVAGVGEGWGRKGNTS